VIARLQSSSSQLIPNILPIHSFSHLQRNSQISTFNSQIESSLLILDEMKCDLGIPFLLEITDNTLSNKIGSSDNLEDFIVILPDEGQFESVLGRINGDGSRFGRSVKAVNDITLDSSQVDGLLEGLDNTVITIGQL
jgi:hypothetical protein